MKTIRTTKDGAKISYERTEDVPATRAVSQYKMAKKKSKSKKSKSKKSARILGKPKAKLIKRLSSIKAIKGIADSTQSQMVTPGKEGFMDREMMKEKADFFGGYSL